jgi:cadmium resistance protein CadD (predicted permease)
MSKLLVSNEHRVDRILRVAVGLGLLALAFVGPKTALGYLGIIPLATGLLGSCPLYSVLGLSTCRAQKHRDRHQTAP